VHVWIVVSVGEVGEGQKVIFDYNEHPT